MLTYGLATLNSLPIPLAQNPEPFHFALEQLHHTTTYVQDLL